MSIVTDPNQKNRSGLISLGLLQPPLGQPAGLPMIGGDDQGPNPEWGSYPPLSDPSASAPPALPTTPPPVTPAPLPSPGQPRAAQSDGNFRSPQITTPPPTMPSPGSASGTPGQGGLIPTGGGIDGKGMGFSNSPGLIALKRGGPVTRYDEGGDVGLDTGDDSADPNGNGVQDPLDVVKRAMAYGRQKFGLTGNAQAGPANPTQQVAGFGKRVGFPGGLQEDGGIAVPITPGQGGAPVIRSPDEDWQNPGGPKSMGPRPSKPGTMSENDADEDDTGMQAKRGGPVQKFDDGGEVQPGEDYSEDTPPPPQQGAIPSDQPDAGQEGVPNQQQEQPALGSERPIKNFMQQATSRVAQYLQSAMAASPEEKAALEARVDPHKQMPEDDRNVALVNAATQQGGPEAGFRIIQNLRADQTMRNAFAATKLQQGNIPAAAQAATDAMSKVPSGETVRFQPTQGGVTATVNPRTGQPMQLALSTEQLFNFLHKGAQFDALMDEGAGPALQKFAGGGPGTAQAPPNKLPQFNPAAKNDDPNALYQNIQARANSIYGFSTGTEKAKQEFIQHQLDTLRSQGNAVDVATAKQKNDLEKARITAGGHITQTEMNVNERANRYARMDETKREQIKQQAATAILAIAGKQANAQEANRIKLIATELNNPQTDVADFEKKYGVDLMQLSQGAQRPAPAAGAAPARGAAPAPAAAKPKLTRGPDGLLYPVQ